MDMQTVKVGDSVFFFPSHSKYPQVVKVKRATQNFVIIELPNHSKPEEPYERKFRRDGSGMERFDGHIAMIEDGEVEAFEKQKKDDARIGEILDLLSGRGFRFNGHRLWYSIEQWEAILAAVTTKK